MPADSTDPMRPSVAELSIASLWGQDRSLAPLDLNAPTAPSARAAIESHLRAAMQRGPVWVAFSGGRDSSALLGIANAVARADGFDLPVAVTMAFPEVSDTDEEGWQRLVLEHLGLTDRWVRLTPGEDLDMIGPYAQRVLRKHGVVIPPNAHAVVPMFEAMGKGTLVSGAGGDELMEGRPQRVSSAVLSRRRVMRDELASSILDDLPRRLQVWASRRLSVLNTFHWLTPRGLSEVLRLEAEERAAAPIRFDKLLQRAFTDRQFQVARLIYERFAADAGNAVLVPFVERDVVSAFARAWGYRFPGARVRSLRPMVGDLLPEALLTRVSKAEFVNVFATSQLHEWVADWDGSGVDETQSSVAALRQEWGQASPHYCSLALLQQAWLAGQSGAIGE